MGELRAFVRDIVVKVTVNATAELGEDTPKLTGWAASNWIPRIGQRTELPFGDKLSVSEAAKTLGLAEVVTSYALPQIVHVTNPVYYIEDLNSGTSAKAPAFFVETAIAKAIKSVV
jgi:hypothetical protein